MSTTTRPAANPVAVQESSSERTSERHFLGLSLPQVIGSALAAATSAVAASFLGVAGTLIGAVVGSVVATIGGAVYSHSLVLAASQLRVVRVPDQTDSDQATPDLFDGEIDPDRDVDPLGAPAPKTKPAERRWLRLVAGLALGVVLALAAITAVELVIGHPISGSTSSGTSVGQVVGAQQAEPSTTAPASPSSVENVRSAPAATATQSATSGPAESATTGTPGSTSNTGTGSTAPTSPAAQTGTPQQPAG